VRPNGNASWNTLRDYRLSYEVGGPSTMTDPATGLQELVAGAFDLTQIQEVGDDGGTTLPPRIFGYTQVNQYYEDSTQRPTPATDCGWSWNQGTGSGCLLWNSSNDSNNRYLAIP